MENLIDYVYPSVQLSNVCLFGFDDESYDENAHHFFPQGHIERKLNIINDLVRKCGISVNGAINLCEVTPAEWELMKNHFLHTQ